MDSVDEGNEAAFRGDGPGAAGVKGIAADGTPIPNPEVSALPNRRRFAADYKARVVEEAEGCVQCGSTVVVV